METLTFLFWMQFKHLLVDFPLQGAYQYSNKGTYGHPGGILHAALHAIATAIVLLSFQFSLGLAVAVGFLELLVHYHIDWGKVNLNKKLGWGMNTHEQFWWLLGFDQFLHQITYLAIAFLL